VDIVSRATWKVLEEQARPKMSLPAREVWLHHSVTGATGDPYADMRAIQRIGIQRFGYFSYSWAAHPSGMVLEGQGLRIGAHTAKRNSISFGVVLIGDYTRRKPTPEQIESIRQLIDWLQDEGHLRRGVYPTGGHRDANGGTSTACPGNMAYPVIPQLRQPWEPPPDTSPEVIVANAPFVAVLAHPSGGYLQVGADGGIFGWGAAPFFGSLGGIALNAPVVGAAWAPDHQGYWMVAADGGVFAFGSAAHHGGMAGTRLNQPVVGISPTDEGGYVLLARDGGVFTFGPGAVHQGNALYSGA
jgi:hypothetical protein